MILHLRLLLVLVLTLIACGGSGGVTPSPARGGPAATLPAASEAPTSPASSPNPSAAPAAATETASPTARVTAPASSPEPATAAASPAPTKAATSPAPAATAQPTKAAEPVKLRVETVASNLEVVWSIAFAPDGRLFFTERPGRIRVIENGRLQQQPVATIGVATQTAEGGLMGLALDPKFQENGYIYIMYTYSGNDGFFNRISRLTVKGSTAGDEKVLLDSIPGAVIHDGGRLSFGPDGKLYATTGDAGNQDSAQNMNSLNGKILRINPDGSIPGDNPFGNSPIYSYGHRNPEGLAWQPGTDRLYETEHGPVGFDEVNRIQAGKNYGWPIIIGRGRSEKYVDPLLVFDPAVAPAGAAFYSSDRIPQWQGNLFFGTLRGRHLHRVIFDEQGNIKQDARLYDGEYGRIRAVAQGPDGALYFGTSNRDGRGDPAGSDDRILRVVPVP